MIFNRVTNEYDLYVRYGFKTVIQKNKLSVFKFYLYK